MEGTEELAVFSVPDGLELERGQSVTVERHDDGYLVSRDGEPSFFSGADGGCGFPMRTRTPLALEIETEEFCRGLVDDERRTCGSGSSVYSIEVAGVWIAPGATESVTLVDGREVLVRNRKVNLGGVGGTCGDFAPGNFLVDIVF